MQRQDIELRQVRYFQDIATEKGFGYPVFTQGQSEALDFQNSDAMTGKQERDINRLGLNAGWLEPRPPQIFRATHPYPTFLDLRARQNLDIKDFFPNPIVDNVYSILIQKDRRQIFWSQAMDTDPKNIQRSQKQRGRHLSFQNYTQHWFNREPGQW